MANKNFNVAKSAAPAASDPAKRTTALEKRTMSKTRAPGEQWRPQQKEQNKLEIDDKAVRQNARNETQEKFYQDDSTQQYQGLSN